MNSKRILIAGCGDLGTGVAEHFVMKGDQVYGIRRSGTEFPNKVHGVTGRLTDLPNEALPEVDLIVLIMTPSERSAAGYRAAYYDTAKRLVQRYHGAQTPILFVSSTSVYGQNEGQWIEQDSQPSGIKETAKILLETEQLLAQALPSVALRCSGIYGPKRYRMLDKVMAGEEWQTNSWTNRVHRHDVVRALCHLAEKTLNGESLASHYNVTDDTPVSMWEVKLCIAHLLGAKVNLPTDGKGFVPASGKRISNQAIKETGFCFTYPSYVSGYDELVKAYLEQQA